MPLKTIEVEGTTYAEVKDGKPVYVDADGAEALYDGESLAEHVTRLNGESATRRRELREAQEKLGAFDGIEDPEAARKALTTVKNLDDKKLVDAGEVDKVKEAAIQATKGTVRKPDQAAVRAGPEGTRRPQDRPPQGNDRRPLCPFGVHQRKGRGADADGRGDVRPALLDRGRQGRGEGHGGQPDLLQVEAGRGGRFRGGAADPHRLRARSAIRSSAARTRMARAPRVRVAAARRAKKPSPAPSTTP